MDTIKDLLDAKRGTIWSISPDASVFDAVAMMAEKEVGALMVIEGEALLGIISERDYTRKVILHGRSSRELAVRDIMTEKVITMRPEQSVEEAMQIMSDRHIRHLPVVVDGRPVGMISMRDLVYSIISDRDQQIQHLERYITGSR